MFWKPTTPSLPKISKRKASDAHLSPAHPKKLKKEDQGVQISVSDENFETRWETEGTVKLKQSH